MPTCDSRLDEVATFIQRLNESPSSTIGYCPCDPAEMICALSKNQGSSTLFVRQGMDGLLGALYLDVYAGIAEVRGPIVKPG